VTAEEHDIIGRYEAIAQTTCRMLDAARVSDWEGLVAHERMCAGLIAELKAAGDDKRALSREGTARKRQIIRKLLADDAEIRNLTQPWLAKLETLLRAGANQRRINASYR
jgi:flagellar protein FliT